MENCTEANKFVGLTLQIFTVFIVIIIMFYDAKNERERDLNLQNFKPESLLIRNNQLSRIQDFDFNLDSLDDPLISGSFNSSLDQ